MKKEIQSIGKILTKQDQKKIKGGKLDNFIYNCHSGTISGPIVGQVCAPTQSLASSQCSACYGTILATGTSTQCAGGGCN